MPVPPERKTGRMGEAPAASGEGLRRPTFAAGAQEDPPHDDRRDRGRDRGCDRRWGPRYIREPRTQTHRTPEVADLPAVRLRLAAELPIRIHGDRVADLAEHRQVRDGVRVRVRPGEIDALRLRGLADRLGLALAVAVER